jgi:hypothetical protein
MKLFSSIHPSIHLELYEAKTLPTKMPYWFKQLQELHLWGFESLEYLPSSFTCKQRLNAGGAR